MGDFMDIVANIKVVLEVSARQSDADARSTKAGYTRGNVGSGVGKMVGSTMAGAPGMIIGHYAGKGATPNKEKKADLTKFTHRAGIMIDKRNSVRQVKSGGKTAAAGAAIGGIVGAATGGGAARGAASGAVLGAGAGYVGSAIKAGYRHAKKMGHGKVGRVASAVLGPLGTVGTPRSQKEAAKKDN